MVEFLMVLLVTCVVFGLFGLVFFIKGRSHGEAETFHTCHKKKCDCTKQKHLPSNV